MASVFLIYSHQDEWARRQILIWHRTHALGLDTVLEAGRPDLRADHCQKAAVTSPGLLGADIALVALPADPRRAEAIAREVQAVRECSGRLVFTGQPMPSKHYLALICDDPFVPFEPEALKRALRC